MRADEPLSVGIVPGDVCGPVYYAQELGFFKNAGIEVKVTVLTSGPAIAAALVGGTLDIGGVNTGSLAGARIRGVPLRAVAPTAIIGNGYVGDVLLVAKNAPLRTGADLAGKTVALNALGTFQHAGAMWWIDSHGGDSKNVKFVELPVPAMAAAIEAGRVDAGLTSEPFTTQGLATTRSLGPVYDGMRKPFLIFAMCATEKWLQPNAAVAAKFAAAVRQADVWSNAREHEKERRAYNLALTKLDPVVIEKMGLWQMGTTLDPAGIAPVIDVMLKYGFLERALNPAEMIWRG